ncbi:MAG: dTDP-glucose 4,6-dehydratase [Pirellulaceae bacterium]|nr:dTDP-glucose 4,6-dehydratase [Pirellulaceae bacterium]
MRLIITGGAGFIGSNLVRRMVNEGHHVLNVDKLTYAGNLNSLADVSHLPNYRFAKLDIADAQTTRRVLLDFCPEAVMHLAAESHVDRSIDGPREFIETNIVGTMNLLQSSLEYWRTLPADFASRFRFLHVSTDEVYGSLGATGLFNEETAYDPHSPYSATKASSDHLARAWFHTYGLPVLVTNCSNNYGPFQFPEKLIPVVILKAIHGEPIPVYGKGENVRDWLYVMDHCDALRTVLLKGTVGETYNIGGNNELKNIQLVEKLCDILNDLKPKANRQSYADQIAYVADRPGHDFRYAIDSSKLRRELGWTPKQDRLAGLRETCKWYLDNAAWWHPLLPDSSPIKRRGLI